MPFLSNSHIRSFLIAAFVLAITPAFARASCGDWLEHRDSEMTAEESSSAEQNPIESPAVPCRGPSCRGSSDGPTPLTPAEVRPLLPKDLDRDDGFALTMSDGRDAFVVARTPDLSDGYFLRIDRPPEA